MWGYRGAKRKCVIGIIVLVAIVCAKLQWKVFNEWREARLQRENRQIMEEIFRQKLRTRDSIVRNIEVYHNATLNNTKQQFPSLIGIGVKKCGTDGVVNFLGHHPQLILSKKIDLEAFFFNRKFEKGMKFYNDMFPPINDREITAEKTPQYFDDLPQNLSQLIHENLPQAKLFLVVCDPSERSFSDYVQERVRYKLYKDPLMKDYSSFDKYVSAYLSKVRTRLRVLEQQGKSQDEIRTQLTQFYRDDTASILISTGLYYYHIQRWLKFYNESNLMIIDGEEFLKNPGPIVERLQSFLGLPRLVWREDFVKHPKTGFFCYKKLTEDDLKPNRNVSEDDVIRSLNCLGETKGRTRLGLQKPSNRTVERLKTFYKPYNKKFFDLIGQKFDWG